MWCDAGSDGAGGPVSRGRSSSSGTEGVHLSALRPGSSGAHPTAAAACGTLGPPGTVPSAVRPVSVHGGDGGIGSPSRWRFVSAFFFPLFSILFSSRLLFSLSFISLFMFLSLSFVFHFIVSFAGVSGAAGRCPRTGGAGQSPALHSAASPRQTGRVLRGVWQLKAARLRSEYRLRGVRGSAASTDPNGTAGIIEATIHGSSCAMS